MKLKLKVIDKLLIWYLFLILVLCLASCKSKHVTQQHIDSVVKEVYQVKDSIHTQTIFEYETIYDTIRKEYTTHIKRVIAEQSQNKSIQAAKDVKVVKDTKEVIKEPIKSNFWLKGLVFIIGFGVGFFGTKLIIKIFQIMLSK